MSKKLIEVDAAAFDELMYWLGRCADKGHLENCYDLVEPWANFDSASWREVEKAEAAEWIEPVALSSAGPVYDQGFSDGAAEAKRLNATGESA